MAGACILLPIHFFSNLKKNICIHALEIKNFNKLRLKTPRTIRKEKHPVDYEKNDILM